MFSTFPISRGLVLGGLLTLGACDLLTGISPVASVEVTPGEATVLVGSVVEYNASVRDRQGAVLEGRTVTWTSSDTTVAVIAPGTGEATAVGAGTVTITATSEGTTGTAELEVVLVPVSFVSIAPDSAVIAVGETIQFQATARDAEQNVLEGRVLTWESSDSSVATVSAGGVATGVGPGSAVISATVEGVKATAGLRVLGPVSSVTITAQHRGTVVGGTIQLTATLRDAGGNIVTAPVSWSTSNSGVATVDSTGAVTGVAEGSATITAASGGISDTLTVTVAVMTVRHETLSAGYGHICGLAVSGAAYCWGSNDAGQLGDGSLANRTAPVRVLGGLVFESISAGASHTCALTAAGAVYCWGGNAHGQLGDGSTSTRLVPVRVSGPQSFRTVSAGGTTSCGINASGAAYCWGRALSPADSSTTTPAPVSISEVFTMLSVGYSHAVAVTPSGDAYAWGTCNRLATTNDSWCESEQRNAALVLGGHKWTQVSAGDYTCGITATGSTYCWGGIDWPNSINAPLHGDPRFTTVSFGGEHGLGIAPSGAAYAWGRGLNGELGHGDRDNVDSSPVPVSGGHQFRSVAAGFGISVGVTTDGRAYAWGRLVGTSSTSLVPVLVETDVVFR
jgi:alpha-tubulin suppressor-like RCC1 family protein